ncbi:TPA: hypothetical protein DF272_03655 [Candidatus Falkowbacteria bacterium]|nr:hypothetical protein [Candidatus Falkowbacteria bacterium]
MLYYFNNIIQDWNLAGPVESFLAVIVRGGLLVVMIPLYILFSYIGFILDAIFHTGVGYESLGVFPAGVMFMKAVGLVYFFTVGAVAVVIYRKVWPSIPKKLN